LGVVGCDAKSCEEGKKRKHLSNSIDLELSGNTCIRLAISMDEGIATEIEA
jgi:hypothetical protein